jgi:hypothetical protein
VTLIGGDLDESLMAYRRLPKVLAHHSGTVNCTRCDRSRRNGGSRRVRSVQGLSLSDRSFWIPHSIILSTPRMTIWC